MPFSNEMSNYDRRRAKHLFLRSEWNRHRERNLSSTASTWLRSAS